jgi:hypothetical protein
VYCSHSKERWYPGSAPHHIHYVHLSSSVARNELMMLREALREKLNEKSGKELIREIVLR